MLYDFITKHPMVAAVWCLEGAGIGKLIAMDFKKLSNRMFKELMLAKDYSAVAEANQQAGKSSNTAKLQWYYRIQTASYYIGDGTGGKSVN